jgi:thiol-disulfide isomerase/thioredoxin
MKSRLILAAAILGAAVATPVESLAADRMHPMTSREAKLPVEGMLASLSGATAWLNSQPLMAEGLRGKVVLVDFWTYTCINWQRTQPYVRYWAEKYKDQGLVVIGVHTPEFVFERDVDNIRPALKRFRVEYPVAVDSNYGIWDAFGNHYWPAVYVADAKGNIRYHHFGEGEYERTEEVIQQLLREAGYPGKGNDAGQDRPPRLRSGRGLGEPAVGGKLSRQRQGGGLRVPRRPLRRQEPNLRCSGNAQAQPMGAERRLDGEPRRGRARQSQRAGRLPLSRARRASRDGTVGLADRRCASACFSMGVCRQTLTVPTSTSKAMER